MSFFNQKSQSETLICEMRSQIHTLTAQRDSAREGSRNAWASAVKYMHELRLVNRAIQRRNKVNRNQREKLERITQAAIELRLAQRAYMTDRGNDAFGVEVARAARALDAVLPPYTREDKRLAALNNGKAPPRSDIDTPANHRTGVPLASYP